MIYVLMANTTEKNVKNPLVKTFGSDFNLITLSNRVITDYSDEKQLNALWNDIKQGVVSLHTQLKNGDEVYVLLVGGLFHNWVLIELLRQLGVEYKMLVYERKLKKYVIMDLKGEILVQW